MCERVIIKKTHCCASTGCTCPCRSQPPSSPWRCTYASIKNIVTIIVTIIAIIIITIIVNVTIIAIMMTMASIETTSVQANAEE